MSNTAHTQKSASKIPSKPQEHKIQLQNTRYVILNSRWVNGESFPGQKSSKSKGYPHQPTEVEMTENESETGIKDNDNESKTKTTFFYSNPSRLPSSHPYPSSALPDHHLVCSVSLLSFASYSHRSRNMLPPYYHCIGALFLLTHILSDPT